MPMPMPTMTATATMTAPPPPPPKPLDHGAVSTKYPAFTPAAGMITSSGGPVLKNPVIITVTWPGDAQASDFEAFGDVIGTGAYWKALTSEYGAAAAVSGAANHVRMTDPPAAKYTDGQLGSFIATQLTTAPNPWPVPATGDPVYILYLPATTTILVQGASTCADNIGGYHDSVMVNGKPVAYAIIPRCGNASTEELTFYASHELVEATTDPYPYGNAAYRGFRDEDIAWEVFLSKQDEVGDACEFFKDSVLSPGDSPTAPASYVVQRQWSNASGAAGHDPCVPEFKDEVYFNTVPLDTEDVTVIVDSQPTITKGYKIKAGTKRQIPLGFYSANATEPWTIKATNGSLAGGNEGDDIKLELDVTSGQNGQKAYLTVTVNTASATNTELITIVSTKGGTSHYMPFMIGN
jgi:hypothetical protein